MMVNSSASSALQRKTLNLIYYCSIALFGFIFILLASWGAYRLQFAGKGKPIIQDEFPYRLPDNISPTHYDIQLELQADNSATFNGRVSIYLKVIEATKTIVLSAEELQFVALIKANADQKNEHNKTGIVPSVNGKIEGVSLVNSKTNAAMELTGFSTADLVKYRKIQVYSKQALEKNGQYSLTIDYIGLIRNDMRGFYQSKAADGSLVLSTQMESEDGRAAIPLFDEPRFKATFQMTITTPVKNDKTRILFNTDEISRSTLSDGRVKVKFDKTPLMSTYLIAFIIGQYDYIEKSADGIRHRIYTPVGKEEQGRDALEAAVKITKFFTDLYGVKYPINKMDQIAIPSFASGAMENFGLITYRETYLLFDNATASQSDKENGIEVVSHEISHQWNGNIITCAYWTQLYLNEGFATFMETYALDKTYPSWKRGLKKLTNSVIYAADADSVASADPIVREYKKIQSKDEIDGLFNSITYDKGGAILNMFFNYLGEETFVKWMRQYFAKYQYQNTNTTQLLELLPVSDVKGTAEKFSTWLYQAGMPIINVIKEADGSLTLTQRRFFSYANSSQVEQFKNSKWWIPLTYVTEIDDDAEVKRIEFPASQTSLKITDKAVKFNHHKNGFYRVNYPKSMWTDLISNIKEFDTQDRFDLFNDLFSIATSTVETIESSLMFDMLLALKEDETSILWESMYQSVLKLNQLLAGESVSLSFSRMVLDLVQKQYEKIGWENRSSDDDDLAEQKEVRPFVLNLACRFGNVDCIDQALKRYHERNTTAIPPELRNVIYRTVVSKGGEREYYQVLEQFKAEQDSVERTKLMYALAYSPSIPLLQNTLELSLSPLVKPQDSIFLIREVARNVPYGTDVAWNFVRSRYDAIVSKCGQDQVSNRLVFGVGSLFNNLHYKQDIETFFGPRLQSISLMHYRNTLEA
nr:unnamed protein product [Naegleria fowleri]